MAFFRSERMSYCQLVLHQETAFDCFVELGYLGKAQFVNEYDKDYVPNLKYSNEVGRCADLQRIILHLQEEINKSEMQSYYYPNVDEEQIPRSQDLPEIESVLQNLDTELTDVLLHGESLKQRRLTLTERRAVIEKAQNFFTGSYNSEFQIASYDSLMEEILHDSSNLETGKVHDKVKPLNFIAGSIPIHSFPAFERMIWRVSRGNAYLNHAELEIPKETNEYDGYVRHKYAFLLLFMGTELQDKLTKICQGFQARIYSCPVSEGERLQVMSEIENELIDLKAIYEKTYEHKRRILDAAAPELYIWRSKIRKIGAVYSMLNQLGTVRELRNQNQKYLTTDCWIPKRDVPAARAALQYGARRAARGDPHMIFPPILNERFVAPTTPPTYFVTNKFTHGFQKLIDAYGIASYQELNPTPYTIITFPFLFAVMFGDVGHGILLIVFAMMMVMKENKIERRKREAIKSNEIFNILFGGRYIILLMGIFSVYTGMIYNDVLSKPLNIFGSSWRSGNSTLEFIQSTHSSNSSTVTNFVSLDPTRIDHYRGKPYLLGVDPVWPLADNNIIIMNSLKMKIAIILGVVQMIFGLCLSAWNALYFKNKADFFLVFTPQIIFFSCLFLYLLVLVFHKWTWFGGQNPPEYGSSCAPSILITFINMVLMKSSESPPEDCVQSLYPGERIVEKVLLFTAILVVPILLLGKPLHFMYVHRKIKTITDLDKQSAMRRSTITKIRKSLIYSIEFEDSSTFIAKHEPEEKLSEVWIHQGIHTIESVLGSVSHTASYLRLWALSLAHSQLSHVLWRMVLRTSLLMRHGFVDSLVVFLCFAFFAVLTLAILVLMEGLSAFLHTLRLHWVEFQSKFYSGMGEAFAPFRFEPSKKSDAATVTN